MDTNASVTLVAVKELKPGMKMDWEGNKYADPDSDNSLYKDEY